MARYFLFSLIIIVSERFVVYDRSVLGYQYLASRIGFFAQSFFDNVIDFRQTGGIHPHLFGKMIPQTRLFRKDARSRIKQPGDGNSQFTLRRDTAEYCLRCIFLCERSSFIRHDYSLGMLDRHFILFAEVRQGKENIYPVFPCGEFC